MIDRTGLESLTPAKRAAVIYSEAQSALSRRLWQAALGVPDADDAIAPRPQPRQASLGQWMATFDHAADMPATLTPLPVPMARSTVDPAAGPMPTPATFVRESPTTAVQSVGLGPNGRHASALETAASRTGIPASALAAIVDAEASKAKDGSWQPYSRNPRSSAAGLGQFLSHTWEGMAETPGTWLNGQARASGWLGANGQVTAESRAALLALRYDPVASINGIADYARRNLDGLRRAGVDSGGGVKATARLAYLGHHLGLGDAIRFLNHGGLDPSRARALLGAQVGTSRSEHRIAEAGSATAAHRDWLLGYLDRKVRPDRFAALA